MLVHIPGVLTDEQVADVRQRLDAAEWVEGLVTAGHQSARVKRNAQLAEGSAAAEEVGDIVLTALQRSPLFPEEYDGGELLVEDTYGVHSVKLPAGHLVLYPSTSLHRVQPVTRGTRLASFFWIQSMIRDDGNRTLLFDLDMAIQRRDVKPAFARRVAVSFGAAGPRTSPANRAYFFLRSL